MSVPLLGHNYLEFLDEKIARGVDTWPDSSYPPLSNEVRAALKVVAEGICVSRYSLEWAVHEALTGDDKRFKGIRERMLSKPVKMVTHA